MKSHYSIVVIGGGPAGMGAALSAYQNGVNDILIIERDNKLGGILNQCKENWSSWKHGLLFFIA